MADIDVKPQPAPELDERPASANGLKRRRSDASEQESKRQRTSPGKNSPTAVKKEEAEIKQESTAKEDTPTEAKATDSKLEPDTQPKTESKEPRRKSAVGDEKQRSKRLFGALLGNLNQPGDRTSKRRQEIEARRKAELQRQDDERIEDKQRRLEQLAEHRRKVQRKVDEENMRIRHAHMLKTANFLQTSSEPRVYYRPWELRPDEEDRVEQQIKEAEELIEKETAEFEGRPAKASESENQPDQEEHVETDDPGIGTVTAKRDDEQLADGHDYAQDSTSEANGATLEEEARHVPTDQSNSDDTPGEALDAQATDGDVAESQTAATPTAVTEEPKVEDDDHVLEGEEDTVIY